MSVTKFLWTAILSTLLVAVHADWQNTYSAGPGSPVPARAGWMSAQVNCTTCINTENHLPLLRINTPDESASFKSAVCLPVSSVHAMFEARTTTVASCTPYCPGSACTAAVAVSTAFTVDDGSHAFTVAVGRDLGTNTDVVGLLAGPATGCALASLQSAVPINSSAFYTVAFHLSATSAWFSVDGGVHVDATAALGLSSGSAYVAVNAFPGRTVIQSMSAMYDTSAPLQSLVTCLTAQCHGSGCYTDAVTYLAQLLAAVDNATATVAAAADVNITGLSASPTVASIVATQSAGVVALADAVGVTLVTMKLIETTAANTTADKNMTLQFEAETLAAALADGQAALHAANVAINVTRDTAIPLAAAEYSTALARMQALDAQRSAASATLASLLALNAAMDPAISAMAGAVASTAQQTGPAATAVQCAQSAAAVLAGIANSTTVIASVSERAAAVFADGQAMVQPLQAGWSTILAPAAGRATLMRDLNNTQPFDSTALAVQKATLSTAVAELASTLSAALTLPAYQASVVALASTVTAWNTAVNASEAVSLAALLVSLGAEQSAAAAAIAAANTAAVAAAATSDATASTAMLALTQEASVQASLDAETDRLALVEAQLAHASQAVAADRASLAMLTARAVSLGTLKGALSTALAALMSSASAGAAQAAVLAPVLSAAQANTTAAAAKLATERSAALVADSSAAVLVAEVNAALPTDTTAGNQLVWRASALEAKTLEIAAAAADLITEADACANATATLEATISNDESYVQQMSMAVATQAQMIEQATAQFSALNATIAEVITALVDLKLNNSNC